ncbi:MAG: SDR family oxidoreductase [Prosthecochloris sp.]|nr:SDR family oxidoreductase [Prosthecochloris sp.]
MERNRQSILVTGATGYIGSEVIVELCRLYGDTVRVRALARRGSDTAHLGTLPVDIVYGDLLDPVSLFDACDGVDIVFHCAGLVAYSANYRHRLYEINVTGTANLVNACLYHGVERLVHTSSVAAVGVSGTMEPANETTPFKEWQHRIAYMESKHLSEMEGMRGIAEGLDVVFVNPGVVLGLPSNSGQSLNSTTRAVRNIYRGKIPLHPSGGISIVDITDVAAAHLAAWKKGRTGSRYLVTAGNYSFRELFTMIGALSGSRYRGAVQAAPFVEQAAGAAGELYAALSGRKPYITIESMRLAGRFLFYSNRLSIEELGMSYRPAEETLKAVVAV